MLPSPHAQLARPRRADGVADSVVCIAGLGVVRTTTCPACRREVVVPALSRRGRCLACARKCSVCGTPAVGALSRTGRGECCRYLKLGGPRLDIIRARHAPQRDAHVVAWRSQPPAPPPRERLASPLTLRVEAALDALDVQVWRVQVVLADELTRAQEAA